MSNLTEEQKDEIEWIVDLHGFRAVLDALAEICNDKAQHVASNWHDEKLAKMWDIMGNQTSRLADKAAGRGL